MTDKDKIQYFTAVLMLISGVVLAFFSCFMKDDVTEGVLWYVAQCVVYAGSIFGVSIYIKSKFEEITKK